MDNVHFSSKSNEWETPNSLYKILDAEFGFDLDAAATDENHKCAKYYTEKIDALKQEWGVDGNTVFLNPPYGRIIGAFIKKAYDQCKKYPNLTVVMLPPARTDTKWWHAYCSTGEVRFIKGRLKFVNRALPSYKADRNFKLSPAPFPSAIVVFGKAAKLGVTSYVDYKGKL